MRLTALAPRWVALHGWVGPDFLIGVSFLCPHCQVQRLAVLFDPPIDPAGIKSEIGWPLQWGWANGQPIWNRTGADTFDTLTLMPSVDAGIAGHWHGFIENGEIK